jgi:tetratricopeptide (TPR) repeat protein
MPVAGPPGDLVAPHVAEDLVALAEHAASVGAWTPLVAAVLVLHTPDSPWRQAAIERLGRAALHADEVVQAQAYLTGTLLDDPRDPARWIRLLEYLAVFGRVADALDGLRVAHAHGMPAALWHATARALAVVGRHTALRAIAEHGVALHPDDVGLWASAAMACLATGDVAAARAAADRALAANANLAAAWIADAHVAIAERDGERARRAITSARLTFAPEAILRPIADATARLP